VSGASPENVGRRRILRIEPRGFEGVHVLGVA
jgi:hypothetical protein